MTGGEAATTAKAIAKIVQIAVEQGWVDKILAAISKKRHIVLLGSAGVGKTNFLKSLKQFPPQAISYLNRTLYSTEHQLKIKRRFTLVDTPGDIAYQRARAQAIRESMAHGKLGIINVVCYGYHEYATDPTRAFDRAGHPSRSYLQQHRQLEIDLIKEALPLIGSRDTCEFFITLVTKADLWWSERDTVMSYYTLGSYADELRKLDLPAPTVQDYCSVIHRFYGRGAVSPDFDEEFRLQKREQLFATITDVLSR